MRRVDKKRRIIIGVIAVVILAALFVFAMHLIEKHGLADVQFGDIGGWGNDDDEETILTIGDSDYRSDDDIDTYLFIGTDAGGEDLGMAHSGSLADFLTLLVVDNTTKKYAFIEIDRNSMADVQMLNDDGEFTGFFTQQICLSHWYGIDEQQRNENTMAAVSSLFGYLDIQHCYELNMADIGAVNHALGGIEVDIKTDMTSVDPEFIKGASVMLTDEQAEKFLRARMSVGEGTNKERMDRQTQYMQKAYNLVMNQLRENPDYINTLYDELQNVVHSEDEGHDLSVLTNQIITYDSQGIISINGTTKHGDTQGDGIEHEEFYPESKSILSALKSVIDLQLMPADPDDDSEDE